MSAVYAPLIRTDPATGELSPGIATEWETSEDGLALTLELQEGLTFQDGTPLNAETVTQSLEQCLAIGHQDVPSLESIEAEGESTLVFSLGAPTAGLVDLLGSRLGLVASPAAREGAGDNYGAAPVGAGPYRMTDFVPGNSATLAAWEDYQEAGPLAPKIDTIEISIITEPSAQAAALTSGQADFGYRLHSSVVDNLEAGDIAVNTGIGVSMADLNIDRSQGPMQDVRVRQAVSYAIDREALAKSVTSGLSDVPAVQPYPPGHPFHFEDLNEAYAYNPEKAKDLLSEAGYADGLELRGVSLDGSGFVDAGVIVSQQLAAVGIEVTFESKALPDATSSFYTNHEYDLFSTGMNSGPDWITIYRRHLDTDSSGNAGNEPVPGGDESLSKLNAAQTEDEVLEALHSATEVFQEQLPIIPLHFSPFVSAWSSDVSGGEDSFAINGEADFTPLGLS
ncbi:ABC transporter substrate-binding protein [Brevibacterium yomogidense]|uniref:ABC transporter substrate-binding protein n=1 Tax=Brevibacterium yomogidense TaxID=946573 RepID=UPI0018DF5D09|nr:ABC transporter substrate-binding protein [Brevibacterium yomogidense]